MRTFRNPHGSASSWRIRFTGVNATASPAVLKVPAGGTASVRITVNTRGVAADGTWTFGEMVMESTGPILGAQRAPLTLPVAVAIQAPVVRLPDAVSLALAAGRSGSATGSVGNAGGSPLVYAVDNTGSGAVIAVARSSDGVTSGFRGTHYSDPAAAGALAQYSADDFTVDTLREVFAMAHPRART